MAVKRQDLSNAQGTTLTGAHGGTQQLGAAAQRRLGTPQPAPRTPPIMDPAQNPGRRDPSTGGIRNLGGSPGMSEDPIFLPPGGPGGLQTFDGGPGMFVPPGGPPGGPNVFHGLNPGAGGSDDMPAIDFSGRAPMFGNPNQGVQAPGSDAGNIDNAIQGLRSQLGISGPGGQTKPMANGGAGAGFGAPLGVNLNSLPSQGLVAPPPNETPYQQIVRENPQLAGPSGPQFRLPGNGRGFQTGNRINPYAALLRQRLMGGAGGGGAMPNGPQGPAARDGATAGLRGY